LLCEHEVWSLVNFFHFFSEAIVFGIDPEQFLLFREQF